MTNLRTHRGGFALMMAIVLIAVVAMCLAAIGATSFMQAERSRSLAEDAQLRQLLLAGADVARNRLEKSAPMDAAMSLPDSLTEQGAAVTLQTQKGADADHQNIEISAVMARRSLSQQVHLVHESGSWQIVSAELGV
jgi:type II secretory pathway component PulK